MTYVIKTKNVAFTGIREGIAIQDGEGKTDDVETARNLFALGYDVQPDPNPKAKAKAADDK